MAFREWLTRHLCVVPGAEEDVSSQVDCKRLQPTARQEVSGSTSARPLQQSCMLCREDSATQSGSCAALKRPSSHVDTGLHRTQQDLPLVYMQQQCQGIDASGKDVTGAQPSADAAPGGQPASSARGSCGSTGIAPNPFVLAASQEQADRMVHDSATSNTSTALAFKDWVKSEAAKADQATDTFISQACALPAILATADSDADSAFTSSVGDWQPGQTAMQDMAQPFCALDAFLHGPPSPACSPDRVATAEGVCQLKRVQHGQIESMLRLLCTIFQCETATVALLTGTIYLYGACGALSRCVCPERWGFCGWSFLNSNHELLVIEDLKADKRFSANFFCIEPQFNIQFYVAAPLVTSDGHRLGTLCIFGQQPKKFDATRGAVLNNLAEMLIRQLEQGWAQEEARLGNAQLRRALSCYEAAYMVVDTRPPGGWRALHLNAAAIMQLDVPWDPSWDQLACHSEGRTMESFDGTPLGSLFDFSNSSSAAGSLADTRFSLLCVRDRLHGRLFDLTFRAASADGLDEAQPFGYGVPSFVAGQSNFGKHLFIVSLRLSNSLPMHHVSGEGAMALPFPELGEQGPFKGLELGPLVGQGGYGKVFRGLFKGRPVAVKVISNAADVRVDAAGRPLEAALTQELKHVGLTRTLAWERWAAPNGRVQLWMVLEYCDRGTLVDAVVKGWLRTVRHPVEGSLDLRAVCHTAYEIASAMQFLHSRGVVHGDLAGGNVMLTSCDAAAHGFCAKVADFGLARSSDLGQRLGDNAYGTVTHMAPEVLLQGEVGKPADVYSWGVLLWEMLTGSRAWAGLLHAQVCCQVGLMRRKLAIPAGVPEELGLLLRNTMAGEASKRPTFQQIAEVLERYLQSARPSLDDRAKA